jgi:ATP-binding protein involved in chromosome partitioning
MINKEKIMEVLRTIEDPELRRPLTDLDMIRSVEIKGDEVHVEVALTVPGCPMKKKITEDITSELMKLDGVTKVNVELGVMTDEQRKGMAKKLYGKVPEKEQPVAGDFAKRVIAVASGKGGVGKSTVTANLAVALSHLGYKVGLLDADVYGFSIPRILGVHGEPVIIDEHMVPLLKNNIQIISVGFFVDENAPVIWRGPLLHKMVNQFISEVLWDQLDYLLIDLPPGTGDVTISISQALPKAEILVVTTPQPVASHTAGRVAKMAEHTKLAVLGVIENMSYYETNGHKDYIFGQGGGRTLADELKVPFLGEIPIRMEIREAADNGTTIDIPENKNIFQYYLTIAEAIAK